MSQMEHFQCFLTNTDILVQFCLFCCDFDSFDGYVVFKLMGYKANDSAEELPSWQFTHVRWLVEFLQRREAKYASSLRSIWNWYINRRVKYQGGSSSAEWFALYPINLKTI